MTDQEAPSWFFLVLYLILGLLLGYLAGSVLVRAEAIREGVAGQTEQGHFYWKTPDSR